VVLSRSKVDVFATDMRAFLVEGFAEDGRSDRQNILPTPFLSVHHIFCHLFPP
jgi:hypothetical protein